MGLPPVQQANARPRTDNARSGFAACLVSRWPEWTALTLYTALLGFAIPYHEPWADEAQAWQLARSLSLHDLFHTYLRYEGSPGLWHFLLWIMIRLHVSYAGMHWISGAVAVAGVSLLLLRAPFHRYIKLLLPFTYFLAFQYAVVARNYVLAPLLLFALAVLWKKSPIIVALLLGLLGNVAFHTLAISVGLAIVYVIEQMKVHRQGAGTVSRSELIAASTLLVFFYGFSIWTFFPPPDVYVGNITAPVSTHGIRLLGGWDEGMLRLGCSLLLGVTQPMLFAALLWIAIVHAMRKRRQTFYLTPAIVFALSSAFYLVFWHAGLVIPMMIAVFWIAGATGPKLRWPTTSDATAVLATVIYLFAVQLGWTLHAVQYDHLNAYSPDRAAAQFLQPYVESGDKVAVTYFDNPGPKAFYAIGILPYFSKDFYLNPDKPFWWWSTRNTSDAGFEHALRGRPAIVLAEYYDFNGLRPFDADKVLHDPGISRINASGYALTHVFCGEQPVRFTYQIRTCHVIFQRSDEVLDMKKPHPQRMELLR